MKSKKIYLGAALLAVALPFILSHPALAATTSSEAGVSNTISFLQTLVNILCAIAGPLCAVYLGIGGFQYITSAGSPSGRTTQSVSRGDFTDSRTLAALLLFERYRISAR